MLSSLNSFGGLSAAEILTLFGSNSSSSPDSASTSAAQSASTAISGSSANDLTNAISAILAQAQVGNVHTERAMTTASLAGAGLSVTTQAAYAAETGTSLDELAVNTTMDNVAAAEANTSNASASAAAENPYLNPIQDVAQFTQSLMEPSEAVLPFSVNMQAVSVAYTDQSPDGSTTSGTEEIGQARIGAGATGGWGGGLTVSVLADGTSDAESESTATSTSASATFWSSDLYQQLESGGASTTDLAEAAYAAQTGSSSSLGDANVTLSLPDTAQQIAYAVAELSSETIFREDNGPVIVTAADAINITIANGAVSLTGAPSAALPDGLPSLASMQQAINTMAECLPSSYPARNGLDLNTYEGSLTLVQLPPESNFSCSDNFITFDTGSNNYNNWALVLPQDTVTLTVSDTQANN